MNKNKIEFEQIKYNIATKHSHNPASTMMQSLHHTIIIQHKQALSKWIPKSFPIAMIEWVVFHYRTLSPSGGNISAGPLVPLAGLIFRDIVCIMGSFNCYSHRQEQLSLILHLIPSICLCLSLYVIPSSIPPSWSCHHAESVPGQERDGCCQTQGTGCSTVSINSPSPPYDITCLRQDNHDESLQSKTHTEEQRAASTQPNCVGFFLFSCTTV